MESLQMVSQSQRGFVSALRRTWTIKKPTHALIDARGEIVGILQKRGDYYSAVQVLQLGDDKPRHLFGSLEGDIMNLNPSAFHYLRGLDDTEHATGGFTGAAERGELAWIELGRAH